MILSFLIFTSCIKRMAAVGAFTTMDQAEDLKAFERRLVEHVSSLSPQARKWRLLLVLACLSALVTGWNWVIDQKPEQITLMQSLWNHKLFTVSCVICFGLFLLGAHKRIFVQQIVLNRTRTVLQDFNMSCDDRGKLILKPRPAAEMNLFHRFGHQGHG